MEDPTVMWKFTDFFVKLYIPCLKNACTFFLPFGNSGVLTISNAKEKCTCDQLADGCVQVGVCFLLYV